MKDVNKTLSERATRFLPVDMKDRLKSAFNRNAPADARETAREDEASDLNAIFNVNRPAAAPKTAALNVPLVSGPAGSVESDAPATKNHLRSTVTDIEDAEIVESVENATASTSTGARASGQASNHHTPRSATEATHQNSNHEDAVSQKSKSRFFGDFSSTESVRLKVEKRNDKRAVEPLPIPANGNSQPHIDSESHRLEQPPAPNFVFEATPSESHQEATQDSTGAVALHPGSPERANIILEEEYESMDAKAHESENGATADANSGAPSAAIVIERNSKFTGQLKFAGAITIEGQVEGELIAGRIVINEGGIVNAAVDGSTVVIAGTVRGDIRAHEELEILPSGIVDGSVTAPAITVHRGGRVEGRCTIGVPRQ